MAAVGSATIESEGAVLAYDWEGRGPLLLTIAGGGGDAPRHAGLSRELADAFTVVRYDRRCSSRSGGNPDADLDMAQQARDVNAIIRALGSKSAYVFGNSGGASIALKLAEAMPESVLGLALHEPPILSVLPDNQDLIAFMDQVEDVFRRDGLRSAMMLFSSKLVGFDAPDQGSGRRIGEQNADANLHYFMAHEMHNLCRYAPDLDSIRAAGIPALLMKGERSQDAYYARTVPILAEALSGKAETVPGNHVSFIFEPAPVAALIRAHFAASSEAMN